LRFAEGAGFEFALTVQIVKNTGITPDGRVHWSEAVPERISGDLIEKFNAIPNFGLFLRCRCDCASDGSAFLITLDEVLGSVRPQMYLEADRTSWIKRKRPRF
jgi:hypothetical protein